MAERLERDYSGAVCKFVMTAASWQTGSGSAHAHRAEGAWEREATRVGDAGPGRLSHHSNRQQTAEQTLDTGCWTLDTGHRTQNTGHGVGSVVARQANDATRTRTRTRTADGRARARASLQQREGADKILVAGGLHCLRGVTGKPEIRMQQPEIRGGSHRYRHPGACTMPAGCSLQQRALCPLAQQAAAMQLVDHVVEGRRAGGQPGSVHKTQNSTAAAAVPGF
jgi:hypothetical protein